MEPGDPQGMTAPRRRMTRTRWWLAAMAALLALVLVAAWFERREIAGSYIDDLLAAKGVPARYRIAELGPGGQRLTDVVIGDPARPDLTADWIETDLRLGLDGPYLAGARAGRVRLRGRLVGGSLTLGALDRLLPARSGAPISLPDLSVTVADARVRLETPAGPVGIKLAGSGNIRSGFVGTLAAVAPRLARGACVATGTSGFWQVRTARGAPYLAGPIRAAALTCGAWRVRDAVATVDTRLNARFDAVDGTIRLAVATVRAPAVWLTGLSGTIRVAGPLDRAAGEVALTGGPSAAYGASATAVRLAGRVRLDTPGFAGTLAADRASIPARWRTALAGWQGSGAGTPAGPLLDRLGAALAGAGRDAAVAATLALDGGAGGWRAIVASLETRAASGARTAFAGGTGLAVDARGVRVDGMLTTGGGGLPDARVAVTQAAAGAPLSGTAWVAPYRVGDAMLALSPVTFRATPGGRTFFATEATLSGPLGDGRIERARLGLQGGWDGRGGLVLNPICTPLDFVRLAVAGLVLDRARIALCPVGRALVTLDRGRLAGGARIGATRLTGRLGGSPLALAMQGGQLRLDDGGLAVDGLAARLGSDPAQSRLDLATLTGRFAGGGIAGRYAGGGGRIGAVPLVLSAAAGNWRLADGVLTLDGGLTVADALVAAPRLNPLPVRDLAFRLAGGRVAASGQVRGPDGTVRVADIALTHDLASGTGEARIAVPGITFGDTLRPEQLTPVVFGVVADVRGTVSGNGLIRWTPQGVTSSGTFGTDGPGGVDLAAAFGPVTGLKTRIAFTDLLALESAPGQVATVALVNPGVPVGDGVFRYQTLAGARVKVEGARWPLAGGALILEPTLLDFSAPVKRHMTFRIAGLDARKFLQTFEYDNLDASGTFEGVLPIVFDADGGDLEKGRLTARDGGTLAYRGEISKENLGTWGNLAFGALRALRFRELELTLDGPLAGNIVTRARFAGVAQGEGTTQNFLTRRLARLPFVFNVRIEAPFRGLIGSVRSFYDPSVLIRQNLPALLREQERQDAIVQPAESDKRP